MKTPTESIETIHFGKFKGTALIKLKRSYVSWLLSLQNLDAVLREKLKAIEAERERAFQQRKARAEMFGQPCFQRTRYSANQRIAYNNARYNA